MRGNTWLVILGVALACLFIGIYVTVSVVRMPSRATIATPGSIALVEIRGVIGTDPDLPTEASSVVQQIKGFSKSKNIKAILLRIDSPGGGSAASQEIYLQLKKAKAEGKKIVASLGSIAASGGYYVACPADRIVAEPATVTGSIGVIAQFPSIEELGKKIGFSMRVVKSAEFKDIGSPFRPMADTEKVLLSSVVADIYDQFVSAVAEDRKLSRERVLALADGRLFTGRQAVALGLVDTLGTFEDAVQIAAQLAGIKGEPKLIRPRETFPFFRRLLGSVVSRLFVPRFQYIAY